MYFTELEYDDEIIENVDLQESVVSSVAFEYCTFKSCLFHKTKFEFCTFTECKFEDCDLSLIGVKGSVFNDVTIINSKAIGIDFSATISPFELAIEDSNFSNTDLSGATFSDTKLKSADFSNARNYFVDPKDNDVRAMKVSLPEAGSFLLHLGLKLV